ncbi:MAG: diiron oxygenase, partial [Pseudonocardia sp.]|nr:diiron oxygenase [Pseudonocardia sp.]
HISFARAEVNRMVSVLRRTPLGRVLLAANRVALALAAPALVRLMLNPGVYRSVGLDPTRARRAAMANPHYRRSVTWMGERIVGFLTEAGMIKGPLTKALWRRSYLLGADR